MRQRICIVDRDRDRERERVGGGGRVGKGEKGGKKSQSCLKNEYVKEEIHSGKKNFTSSTLNQVCSFGRRLKGGRFFPLRYFFFHLPFI